MGGCVKILSEGFLTFALWVSQADRFPSSYGTVLLLPDWWCTVSHFLFDPLPPLADILSRSENNKHFVRLSSCLVRMYSTVDVYLNSSPPHQCSLCQIVTQVRACLTGLKAEIFSQPISYASHPSKYVLFFGAQHLLSDESNRSAPGECVSAAAAQSRSLPPSLPSPRQRFVRSNAGRSDKGWTPDTHPRMRRLIVPNWYQTQWTSKSRDYFLSTWCFFLERRCI